MPFIKTVVPGEFVLKVEWIMKRNLWGYRGDDSSPFLKITINEARNLTKVRDKYPCNEIFLVLIFYYARLFEGGECSFSDFFSDRTPTFESNIAYPLRFMIDTKVSRNNLSLMYLTSS